MYGAQFSFTVFFPSLLPLASGSRATLSGVYTLFTLVYSTCAFPVGLVTDRLNPRLLIAAGGTVFALGFALSGRVTSIAQLYVTFGLTAAIGMSVAYVVPNATVFRWFPRRSGAAIGIAAAGVALGGIVVPPVSFSIVERVGWRQAFVVLGVAVIVTVLASAMALRTAPERTDGAAERERAPLAAVDMLAAPQFWLLGTVCAANWLPMFAMWAHLFPMALARDVDRASAAAAVSVFGVTSLVGRLGWCALSDRYGRSLTIAICLGGQAVAFLGLATLSGAAPFFVAVALFGATSGGSVPLLGILAADIFGSASAGRSMGGIVATAALVATLGPVMAGRAYDVVGSYRPTFVLGVVLNAAALAVLGRVVARGRRVVGPARA